MQVRKTLGLYANVRPCLAYAPYVETNFPGMDVVIVRENEGTWLWPVLVVALSMTLRCDRRYYDRRVRCDPSRFCTQRTCTPASSTARHRTYTSASSSFPYQDASE